MNPIELVKIVLIFLGILSLSVIILLSYVFEEKVYELLKLIPLIFVLGLTDHLNNILFRIESSILNIIYGATLILSLVLYVLYGKKTPSKEEKEKKYTIRLEHEGGVIVYDNPFNGFLVYGGAEAGKTSSIGKPLLGPVTT